MGGGFCGRQMPNGLMPNCTHGFAALMDCDNFWTKRFTLSRRQSSAAQSAVHAVFFPARLVGKIHVLAGGIFFRIRIKIIVNDHAIHVVAFHDIENDGERARLRRRFAGIEPGLLAVMPDEFGMRAGDVIRRGRRFGFGMAGAKRIEPRVQFQPALVRLGDGERERIVKRFRRTGPACR